MKNKYFPDNPTNLAGFFLRGELEVALKRLNNKTDNIISLNKMKKELADFFKNKQVAGNN
jgi:hypothetical protein